MSAKASLSSLIWSIANSNDPDPEKIRLVAKQPLNDRQKHAVMRSAINIATRDVSADTTVLPRVWMVSEKKIVW